VADGSNKTTPTGGDVDAFLAGVADAQRRADASLLVRLIGEVTGQPAVMWGPSIVGFGSRHYRYASGREGDVPAVGFSPRKAYTAVYLTGSLDGYADLLSISGRTRRARAACTSTAWIRPTPRRSGGSSTGPTAPRRTLDRPAPPVARADRGRDHDSGRRPHALTISGGR
jgi:hypothetical protein